MISMVTVVFELRSVEKKMVFRFESNLKYWSLSSGDEAPLSSIYSYASDTAIFDNSVVKSKSTGNVVL